MFSIRAPFLHIEVAHASIGVHNEYFLHHRRRGRSTFRCRLLRTARLSYGSRVVPAYRFYTLFRADETIKPPTLHDLPDDDSALAAAKKLLDGHDIEVWQGPRRVRHLDSKD